MTVDPGEVIHAGVRPTETEIVRARRAVLGHLAEGDVVDRYTLATAVMGAEDQASAPDTGPVRLPEPGEPDTAVRAHPRVAWERGVLAGMWALAELVARGLVIACETVGESSPDLGSLPTIRWTGPRSGQTQIRLPRPRLQATHYCLAPAVSRDRPWYADPDLFVAELGDLSADPRTRRCVTEALDAWRRGLYLATVNMLGAAFEGMWMAAGQQLRGASPSVDRAVDADPPKVATVQRAVAGLFESRGLRFDADALTSQAGLLRDLRNYGVHPRPATDERLERYLDEATCGLLILTTHHHMVMLADAVNTIEQVDQPAG